MGELCIDTQIEKALKDKNIIKIMNKASKSFTKQLDQDSIYTCQINALWKAFMNYKPEKKTKFTTYLYHGVFIECIKEVKFIKKFDKCVKKLHDNIPGSYNQNLLLEIMDELETEEERELINDKLMNMTIDEIAKKRNSNRETTRKKLKKAMNKIGRNFS